MPRYSRRQKAALDALMRDDVYRHAVEIIEAEGLPGLTLDRLAKAVGVSRATLYNYFDDRDAIVDHVEERTFLPLLDSLAQIADCDAAPIAKLEAIAVEAFAGVYDNRALVVAVTPEKHCAANRSRQSERRRSVQDTVQRVIEEGVRTGVFRELSPDRVTEIFVSTLSGLIDSMAQSGEFRTAEELVPTLMEIFVRGLKT